MNGYGGRNFQPHRCKTADYLEGVKSGCFDLSNACDCFGGILWFPFIRSALENIELAPMPGQHGPACF